MSKHGVAPPRHNGGMDLHVLLGPHGAGKAGRAVARVREAAAGDGEAFLVVPGAVDRARFLRELAATGNGVALGVEVGTFDQLIARLAGAPPVRRTDRAMERLIVRDALAAVSAFRQSAQWAGFVDTARHHVDRLRRAQVWGGSELERVHDELPGGSLETWEALVAEVDRLLGERRLRDDAWFEQRARRALQAKRCSLDAVVVYGFEALPDSRVALIERLAQVTTVMVSLPWRAGRRVHERAADLRDRWRSRGAHVEEVDGAVAAHPYLAWLGAELFEDAPSMPPVAVDDADGAVVSFVDCCGPLQEAEEVVREVAALAADGIAYDSIAVAGASASADAEVLLAAFRRAGIPAQLQARRMAIEVPAGRGLHDLVRAICDEDPLALVAALRAPIFHVPVAVLDRAELALRGTARAAAGDPLHAPDLRAALPAAVAALIESRRTPGDVLVAFRDVLGALLPGDSGELELLRGVVALLEGLTIAGGGADRITLVDLRDALAAFPLVVPDRSDAGQVVIAGIEDLRSVRFDGVVVRGMHLAGFRARVDDDLEAPAAARDLVHLVATRARRSLRIVRQAAGSDGGHLAPSPAWSELRRLALDAPLRTRRLGDVVVAPDAVVLHSEVEPSIALAIGAGTSVTAEDPLVAHALTHVESMRRLPRDAQLTGAIAATLANTTRLSVTEVEAYAVCSAKWFIDKRLRIDDPDGDRARMLDGNVAHGLLEWLDRLDAATLAEQAPTLVAQVAAKVDPRGILDAARLERIAAHVSDMLRAEEGWKVPDVIETERSLERDHERAIAPGLQVGEVEVVGRIDRVDRHGNYVVLHDYKYRSSGWGMSELIPGRHLQLLVYWLALRQAGVAVEPIGAVYRAITDLGAPSGALGPGLRDIGMIGPRKQVLEEDDRAELLEQARELVVQSVEGIRAGRVAPLPTPAECPAHCTLQNICRVGEAVHAVDLRTGTQSP
ncbi:MAG: ATP-dependent nuclease subunit B-like protein [Thermoleophilia bacterium]|nr:ATP-dependent nuclease subunit B-like protein [Thermoleophilia bacterium]